MTNPSPNQVKQARKDAGLTQKEAAKKVKVHWTTWQRWELGTRTMPEAAWHLFKIKTRSKRK